MPRPNVGRSALKAVGHGALGSALGSHEVMHPNLGLHSAAASGNIGLIKFALENGQPANSNLNGILPLHAACSGGNEQAVRMLLLHGAEVNAPRLRSKNSGGGAGVEGSTPLHFAAANGHLEIMRILLEAGARPAATDKEGTSAEALAAGNGHTECVKLLRSWIAAYGTNGLAGIVSARDTVRRDMSLGSVGYPRYAAGGQPSSSSSAGMGGALAAGSADENPAAMARGARSGDDSMLRGQRSFDQLARAQPAHRSHTAGRVSGHLLKTSSNPNLKGAPGSTGDGTVQRAQAGMYLAGQPPTSSPTGINRRLTDRSPSPLDPAEESELAFSSAATPAGISAHGVGSSATGFGGARESKRRPSLPSILEKAAHPAASLRAALGTGPAGSSGGEPPDSAPPHSPNRKFGKLASKRSLSNMLRKATGTDKASVSGSSSASSLVAAPHDPSTPGLSSRPPRSEQRSYDTSSSLADGSGSVQSERRPTGLDASHPRAYDDHDDDSHLSETPTTAPHHRSAFPDATQRPDPAAGAAYQAASTSASTSAPLRQQPRLRGSASSSALSASAVARNAARARSSSNEQIASAGRHIGTRTPMAGKASLDIARAEQLYPGASHGLADVRHADGVHRGAGPQDHRQATGAGGSLGMARARRTGDSAAAGALQEHELSSDFTSSDGSLSTDARERAGSQLSQHAARCDTSFDSRTGSQYARPLYEASDLEDDQELLGDTMPMSPEEAAGEHHDVHHLPAGLRTLSARRGAPRQDASSSRMAGLGPSSSNPSSPSVLGDYRSRNRSTSSVSAVSAGSQTGPVGAAASQAEGSSHLRDSPGLQAASQALSIADEMGMSHPTTRANRSGSHADSVSSRPSTSSLRSTYLSAAEQAQAILNQEVPVGGEGPDGAPPSLAAQLAAYGEALAQERKRSGDARSGPSPSLSGRASSAALKTALPSVSEDQSPTATSSPLGGGGRRQLGGPAAAGAGTGAGASAGAGAGAAFTGHSYPRRQSRRPHSSEGTETQSASKRAGFHTDVLRSKTVNESSQHSGLRNLFLDAPTTPNLDPGAGHAHKALGSPLSPRLPVGTAGGDGGQRSRPTAMDRSPYEQTTGSGGSAGPSHSRVAGRASEDLLRQQRPTILTWNSEATLTGRSDALPVTPVMSNGHFGADGSGSGSSPRGNHRHSPSAPSQLSSYASQHHDRSPSSGLTPDSRLASGHGSGHGSGSGNTPPVPPRKDSYLSLAAAAAAATPSSSSSNGLLTPDVAATHSQQRSTSGPPVTGSGGPPPSPHPPTLSSKDSSGLVVGLGFEGSAGAAPRRPSRDVQQPQRPSMNMMRTATSSTIGSQSTTTGPEDGSHPYHHDDVGGGGSSSGATGSAKASGGGTLSGKRKQLVRNFLSGIKSSASGSASSSHC
ncbi:uncharacterized protein PSFLO_07439 [Pseudozyma flocculosa]|uniref:Uncharacterized protein n=1 Tax=Pseudozyma flocculosa TaxID=84751 RepID=A0A5C3FCS7_9BASI|nr:uncharacterized protein PSFLO_07439 [Pseudozyma flocculosa]